MERRGSAAFVSVAILSVVFLGLPGSSGSDVNGFFLIYSFFCSVCGSFLATLTRAFLSFFWG